MIDFKKAAEKLVILGLTVLIIINMVLIIFHQGLIVSATFNYCTIQSQFESIFDIEECLRIESLKLTGIFIPLIISIVLYSVILIELISKSLGKRISNALNDVREENELMASPFSAALTTRTFLTIPFHVWDLGFTMGFIVGSIVGTGLLRLICVLMSVWCGFGAYVDYKKFKKIWR